MTMHAATDSKRIITVTVNNASMFKVGQYVAIKGDKLMPQTAPMQKTTPSQKVAPSTMQAR